MSAIPLSRLSLLSVLFSVACTCASYAADPQLYAGDGTVFVLSDGTVIVDYGDSSRPAEAYEPTGGSSVALISDGATTRLVSAAEPAPLGTKTKVPLDGTQPSAVAQFSGFVSLAPTQTASQWALQVFDNETGVLVFESKFSNPEPTASSRSQRTVVCPLGRCTCVVPAGRSGVCWCFCGLLGEPHCILIRIVFGILPD